MNSKSDSPQMKAHLFVCTNRPDKEGKCGSKGSEKLRDEVKERCRNAFGKIPELRVNASGCLGYCEQGISAVLYPQGRWFLELKADDGEKLFEAVTKAMKGE
jgi:predicted metal-binding protein